MTVFQAFEIFHIALLKFVSLQLYMVGSLLTIHFQLPPMIEVGPKINEWAVSTVSLGMVGSCSNIFSIELDGDLIA